MNRICPSMVVVLLAAFALFTAARPARAQAADIDIPFQKFVLDNGLTVIIHEDHKAPIVAVNVWYHVGSKNERPGRTGLAHLFEHLMFNGSEHFDDDYFQVMERIGATELNGTTSEDRTNYFQDVPSTDLDIALWMESDRMGHLLGAVTQAKLDEQRGVVQNEKRQWENQPYGGRIEELIPPAIFPAGHPYSWTVIGSMADLDAATLDDAHQWFNDNYGAANAVLVIAGDVDTATALDKVKLHFGDIPAGPPVAHHRAWVAPRTGTQRQTVQDRVPAPRIYKIWNVPQFGTVEADQLELVASILSRGKTSRLYKRLVYDDQIATDVTAFIEAREIAGIFYIIATARPGGDLAAVENAIDEEMARFLKDGPDEKELRRARTRYEANFIRGIERIGGFGGKSDILAQSEVFGGSPDFYKTSLRHVREATAGNLLDVSRRWLEDGQYVLEVHSFPEYSTSSASADRSKVPPAGAPPEVKFPPFQRTTLSNGLKVVLARRDSVPVVQLELIVDAGFAADQLGLPGTADLAAAMLDEGTKRRSALEISDEAALLGARIYGSCDLDSNYVVLDALKENLDASLDLYADVILNPAFPQNEFERLQKETLAGIEQEKASPVLLSLRLLPQLLYGKGHAYANPFTGSGTPESVAQMTREDLVRFHQTWFVPNNATLIIVGATSLDEIAPRLEKLFASWARRDVPVKNLATVPLPAPALYIVDKPEAEQSVIIAGQLAPPSNDPDQVAIEVMNEILGGSFTSRINMNLREQKHWTYGARSLLVDARGQRPFIAYAPVQTDKTRESITEIFNELNGICTQKPATADELAKVQNSLTLGLPGNWETAMSVRNSLDRIVTYGLPDDYYATYPAKVTATTIETVTAAANKTLHNQNIVWIVVGDRTVIEPLLAGVVPGEIHVIDADGNPVLPR